MGIHRDSQSDAKRSHTVNTVGQSSVPIPKPDFILLNKGTGEEALGRRP